MKKSLLSILTVFLVAGVCENVVASVKGPNVISGVVTNEKISNMRVPFIMNKGQETKEVSFYAKTFGGTVFITKQREIVYSMPLLEDQKLIKGLALKESIVGAKVSKLKGEDESITKVSYYQGKEPSKWANNIQTYDTVNLGEVYDGIELKLKASGNNVEKLFYVNRKANPDSIKIAIDGAEGIKIADNGELLVDTALGTLRFTKPIAYQVINGEIVKVPATYNILHASGTQVAYGFKVGEYNKDHPIVIDPLLASTFVGGSNGEYGDVLTLDASNNVYVAGRVYSTDYPTTIGAYDTSFNGNWDIYISKLDSSLTTLISSTFIGGTNEDGVGGLAIDTSGNVYVAGWTWSSNYPTVSGSYDTSFNGGIDAFISKLDSNLTTLLASTFIGGSSYDEAHALVIDSLGNIIIAGKTTSGDYPITVGAYDSSLNGYKDIFVSKLNNDLTSLSSSTYIGGAGDEEATALAIDSSLNVYVTGYTASTDYPTTNGAYDSTFNGSWDVFISKLNNDFTGLLASTFIGGSGSEGVFGSIDIALDGTGNVYVTGNTDSADYPTTAGAYDQSFNGGTYDIFVSKVDNSLSSLLASTFIGGSGDDFRPCIAIASSGNVYVAGMTSSTNFPTTPRVYDRTPNGATDAFVSELNSGLTTLLASTYIGGSYYDRASDIAVNSSGNIYIAGDTESSDYPTSIGAYDTSYNGIKDVFVSVLDSGLSR